MICQPCRDAADNRLTRDFHCADPGCTCGHRVKRYGTVAELPPIISVLREGEDPDDVASVMQALAAEQFAFETWPTCTATWSTFDGIAHCEERADHYPPGQVHLGRTPSGVSYQWIDEEDGATPHTDTTTDRCRAEYHKANEPSARCELAASHDGDHCQKTGPDVAFNWPDAIAMYPGYADATRED